MKPWVTIMHKALCLAQDFSRVKFCSDCQSQVETINPTSHICMLKVLWSMWIMETLVHCSNQTIITASHHKTNKNNNPLHTHIHTPLHTLWHPYHTLRHPYHTPSLSPPLPLSLPLSLTSLARHWGQGTTLVTRYRPSQFWWKRISPSSGYQSCRRLSMCSTTFTSSLAVARSSRTTTVVLARSSICSTGPSRADTWKRSTSVGKVISRMRLLAVSR